MDEHINRFVQRHSLSVGHGQEAEAHADVEPLAHAGAVERLRILLGARPLVLLGLTHSCKDTKKGGKKTVVELLKKSFARAECVRKNLICFGKKGDKNANNFKINFSCASSVVASSIDTNQ